MNFRSIAALVVIVATSSPACAQTLLDGGYPADAPITFDELHQSASSQFNDPRSAQYQGIHFPTGKDHNSYVCGWVNAKNAAGGYGPFIPFQYISATKKTFLFKYFNSPNSPLYAMDMHMYKNSGC